jgi:hypothetical protein
VSWREEFCSFGASSLTTSDLVKVDRFLGNFEGWKESFDYKTLERGVMTHVYAAFEPELKGRTNVVSMRNFGLTDGSQHTTAPTCSTGTSLILPTLKRLLSLGQRAV